MERRDFLKVGTAAGVASMAGPACSVAGGGQLINTPTLGTSEMDGYLARLDRGLEAITGGDLLGDLIPRRAKESAAEQRKRQQGRALAQKGLRTLLLTGAYKDLPEADRRHPGMQQRLERGAPEMDQALFGMTGLLAGTSAEQRAAIQTELKRQPDLGLRLAESLNGPAKELGVSMKRRAQLRTMSTHLAWRMRVQSPSLVMDDLVGKVRRVTARNGQEEELKRHLATRIGEEAFWRNQTRLAMAGGTEEVLDDELFGEPAAAPPEAPAGPDEPGVAPLVRSEPYEARPLVRQRGGALVSTGLWMMGTGAGTLAIGGGLVAAESIVGAFIMTAGGLAIVGGLIVLVVGLLID